MRPKLCMGLIIIFICMAATTATVLAAPHLSWYTQALDYDETNALIIQGYLENDGTVVIDRVNLLTLNIYFKQKNTDWWFANQGNWENIPVYLQPGDTHKLKLRIVKPRYYQFDDWKITGNVNYHIIRTADL